MALLEHVPPIKDVGEKRMNIIHLGQDNSFKFRILHGTLETDLTEFMRVNTYFKSLTTFFP